MAGFRVVLATEFVPAAQQCYKENHPRSYLETRDIRDVSASEMMINAKVEKGELDVLEGSPPCAAFSSCGVKSKGWSEVRKYSDTSQRVDDLFFEFARLVEGIQPKVFVAENVAGLVQGDAKGYFKDILRTLKSKGYAVEARLLDAQYLGVPQRRRRF